MIVTYNDKPTLPLNLRTVLGVAKMLHGTSGLSSGRTKKHSPFPNNAIEDNEYGRHETNLTLS